MCDYRRQHVVQFPTFGTKVDEAMNRFMADHPGSTVERVDTVRVNRIGGDDTHVLVTFSVPMSDELFRPA